MADWMKMYFPDNIDIIPTPMTVKISKMIHKFMNFEKSSPKKSQHNSRKRTEAMTSRGQAIINTLAIKMLWP